MSFADNMQNVPPSRQWQDGTLPRQRTVIEQLERGGMIQRKVAAAQNRMKQQKQQQQHLEPSQSRNSVVAFAMDNDGYEAKGEVEEEKEARNGWPKTGGGKSGQEDGRDEEDKKRGMPEEDNPQLYCKYLEVAQKHSFTRCCHSIPFLPVLYPSRFPNCSRDERRTLTAHRV